ncbi:MAG TPA: hypothetical protein VGA98_04895 [Allosphingosinicella sp.]|jgi:hypothetical protein
MKPILHRAAVLAMLLPAFPAFAQSGAMWTDPYGRMMSMQFVSGNPVAPEPRDRSPAEMASLFRTLCLESGGDGARLAASAAAAGLGAVPHTIPATKKSAAVTLGVWTGGGLILSQTSGFFAAPNAQCNATFYVRSLPERQAVTDALAAVIGRPPSNLASATDKKGRLKKFYNPEWSSQAGEPRIITAFVAKGYSGMPGDRVQISIRAARKSGR